VSPPLCVTSELSNVFHFEKNYFCDKTSKEYVQIDETDRILGEIVDMDLPYDSVFVERTNAAFDRVSEDDGEWLSVEDFLKELETW